MKTFTTSLLGLGWLFALPAMAGGGPTARVQVIHNCADLAAATVDVWLDNTLLIDDFAFRTASSFIDAPAGVPFAVGIAPSNSDDAGDAIFTQNFTLAANETYVIVASGIVSASGYTPAPAFSLEVFDQGREASAGGSMMTDVLVYHGSTDAPTVDVYESAVVNTTIVDNASYTDFAGYLELPTLDFTVQVRTADNSTIVAAYSAPLSTLGLGGSALTVLASGFLDPAVNSGGASFGLYVALPSGGALIPLPAATIPTARVQVIHNSADLAAAQVDVWLNNTLLLDDFAFRTASPFVDLQAGVDLTIGVAPSTSDDAGDAIAQFNYNLPEGGSYILVANGIVSGSGYTPNVPFDLYATGAAQETAGLPTNTDVLVFHGSTDAPVVDVYEADVLGATAVNDLAYGSFAGYLALPTADYTLQVRDAANTTIVAAYSAPLATLGLQGQALTVLASGFLDPANNSGGPAFGLYVALSSGGALIPLPSATIPTARVQVIHNSADLAAAQVDVWLNNTLLLDNFAFRTSSPFVDAQAGVDLTVGIAPPTSDDASDAIAQFPYNLTAGETYILIANGIVSASGYSPNKPFNIYVEAGAREAATSGSGNTDLLVFHGCTDAPIVDVAETAVLGGATIVDNLDYGFFQGYLEVPTLDYSLQVQDENGNELLNYLAPLSSLGLNGAALTVLASGFLDPSMNSGGAGFGLWASLASGGALVELPLVTGVTENDALGASTLWPNPATDVVTLDLDLDRSLTARVEVLDATGRVVVSQGATSLAEGQQRLMIPVSGLGVGQYDLRITTDSGVVNQRFHVVR